MTITPLKGLWIYNGLALVLLMALSPVQGAKTSTAQSAPPAVIEASAPRPGPTFGLTAEAFQTAFNQSAAREENGQHNDRISVCVNTSATLITCKMSDETFVKGSQALAAAGAPYPDGDEALNEYILLTLDGDQISQVEVRGHSSVGRALHLSGTLTDAATALGADLLAQDAMLAFIKATGLLTPAAAQTGVAMHRAWGEIGCNATDRTTRAFACAFTPAGTPVRIPAVKPSAAPAPTDRAPTLPELGAGTAALWEKATDENKAFFTGAGIALIDQQRNVGLDETGQRAVAVWLQVCLDREAPRHPNQNLLSLMNDCMQSMTPQDAAAIAIAQSEMKSGR